MRTAKASDVDRRLEADRSLAESVHAARRPSGPSRAAPAAAPAPEAVLRPTGAGKAAIPVASTLVMPASSQGAADAVIAAGAAKLAALAPAVPGASDGDDGGSAELLDGSKMTEAQRSRELSKISARIGELLGSFEDGAGAEDEGMADDELVQLKDGIMTIAKTLRKKALMRVAFLQSAHMQLSKSRFSEEEGDQTINSDSEEEEDGGLASDGAFAGNAIDDMRRDEGLKKKRLATAHSKAVCMHTCVHACMHACRHATPHCMHACAPACAHLHARTCMHTGGDAAELCAGSGDAHRW